MATPVPSDGKTNKRFIKFIDEFDKLSNAQIESKLAWFAVKKNNGQARLDDVDLEPICIAAGKFVIRYNDIPPILKQWLLIRLRQGKKNWSKGLTMKWTCK